MAKDFYETSKAVRDLFQSASDAISMDLKKLLFESDEETLRQTKNTQIAMVTAESRRRSPRGSTASSHLAPLVFLSVNGRRSRKRAS
jgi:hypothetical protein